MEGAANGHPAQGADPAAAGVNPNAAAPAGDDWRTNIQREARARIVNKIMETLKKHLPVTVPEGLSELQRIAVRFEERMFALCTSQTDYLRKISLKMLSMESKTSLRGTVLSTDNAGSTGKGEKGNELRCHFCKRGGHFKKDCRRRENWFKKKGIAYDPTH
ncbi:hypothetical protein U9M48_009417 [Paspalum notatum var. saurae]|uniref:CCHC-type domain-containing protein n=1 Tax=Paspalum notatum var. saurae TaxID=547442 RepID=A0AAQ3SR43_PASNO